MDDPLQFVEEDADEHREFHRDGFSHTGRWRICWLGRIEELASRSSFCLKSRIFLTASELIRSCFHKSRLVLECSRRDSQVAMLEWSSRAILSRRLQASSSHPMACCESLYVSLCWNRWRIEFFVCSLYLFLNSLSLVCTCVVPRFLSGEHHVACSIFDNDIRDGQCIEPFPCQTPCKFFGNQACTTSTIDGPFCPTLQAVKTLNFERDLAQLEAFHVSQIMDYVFLILQPKRLHG